MLLVQRTRATNAETDVLVTRPVGRGGAARTAGLADSATGSGSYVLGPVGRGHCLHKSWFAAGLSVITRAPSLLFARPLRCVPLPPPTGWFAAASGRRALPDLSAPAAARGCPTPADACVQFMVKPCDCEESKSQDLSSRRSVLSVQIKPSPQPHTVAWDSTRRTSCDTVTVESLS